MPRKTEIIDTFYRGVAADGEVIKESKSRSTVARYMRHRPDGIIETRHLVGYYTPWTPATEPGTRAGTREANDKAKKFGGDK